MAIDRELLNHALVAVDVRTGVFQSNERRIAVVVRVAKDKVHYLHFDNCTVQLAESWKDKFLRDYPLQLQNYPALRGVRHMARFISDGFKHTAEASRVIRAILKG